MFVHSVAHAYMRMLFQILALPESKSVWVGARYIYYLKRELFVIVQWQLCFGIVNIFFHEKYLLAPLEGFSF